MRHKTICVVLPLILLAAGVEVAQDSTAPNTANAKRYPALWPTLKRQLISPDGMQYFQGSLKDASVPDLVGTVLSSLPKDRPEVLVLALSDRNTPEVTLRLKERLKSPLVFGCPIRFRGVAKEFTQEPFMLTFEVLALSKIACSGR